MRKNKAKMYISAVAAVAVLAIAAIFFVKFDKQFKISDVVVLGTDYDVAQRIDKNASAQEVKDEIAQLTAFLSSNGLNTVIVPVNTQKDSIVKLDDHYSIYSNTDSFKKKDVVHQLKNALAKNKIQLFLAIDCENLSEEKVLDMAKQLHKEYAVAGVVIRNYTGGKELLQTIKLALNKGYKKYSVMVQTSDIVQISEIASLGSVDGFIAENVGEEDYSLLKTKAIPSEKLLLHYSSPSLASDMFVLANFGDFDGAVLTKYTGEMADLTPLKLAATKNEKLPSFNLSVPNEFKITYPQDGFSTYYSGVYMTGTGDRGGNVTVNGEEYPAAKDGVFGIFLQLEKGENIFHITQDGETKTLNITRKVSTSSSGGGATKWDDTEKYKAEEGQLVETVGDLTSVISNKEDDSTIIAGLTKGTRLVVIDSEKTTRSGKYTYAYKLSNGAYVLAKNVKWVDEVVETYLNKTAENILTVPSPTTSPNSQQIAQSPTPTPTPPKVENTKPVYKLPKITGANYEKQENGDEILAFPVSGMPAVISKMTEEGLELLFLNTTMEAATIPVGDLYSSLSISQKDEGTYITLKYNPGNPLWGYTVTVDGEKATIYLKKAPKQVAGEKPLAGLRVLLDAGHGETDTGAVGASGGSGPCEKDINLALTLATKACLEEYGATVLLTRGDDTFLSLEERRAMADNEKPDIFIAIHHNSLDYSVDSSKASGSECYYFTPQSKALAEAMCENVTTATGRKNRGAENDYYYVTRTSIAPSVLMEYSFIINPQEFSKTYTDSDIYKAAYGTLQAVMAVVPK